MKHTSFIKHSLMLLLALFAMGELRAQLPIVDVTLVQTMEGPVEVRIRPDGPFDGLMSSIVFTVRWADGQANLGTVQQFSPVNFYCGVTKSGPEQVSDGFRYQVFAGFGFIPLTEVPTAWTGGEEIVLCRVNVINGSSAFSIVNDDWTNDINNNGNYFISLNGQDRTGEIYTISTAVEEGGVNTGRPVVSPNPADRFVSITMPEDMVGPADLRIMDAAGRTVRQERLVFQSGTATTLDVSALPSGSYMLQVVSGAVSRAHRIVVQH